MVADCQYGDQSWTTYILRIKVQWPPLSSFLCRILRTFTKRPVAGWPMTLNFNSTLTFSIWFEYIQYQKKSIIITCPWLGMWSHPVPSGILVVVHHSGILRHLNNLPLKYLIDCPQLSECWHFEAFKVFRTIQSCKFWVKIYNAMKTKLSVPTFRFSTKRTIRPLKWGKWVFWIPLRWVHFNMLHKNSGVRSPNCYLGRLWPGF